MSNASSCRGSRWNFDIHIYPVSYVNILTSIRSFSSVILYNLMCMLFNCIHCILAWLSLRIFSELQTSFTCCNTVPSAYLLIHLRFSLLSIEHEHTCILHSLFASSTALVACCLCYVVLGITKRTHNKRLQVWQERMYVRDSEKWVNGQRRNVAIGAYQHQVWERAPRQHYHHIT